MKSFSCSGMQNILNGFMRYRSKLRGELIKQFESVSDHPHPQNLLITCIDSRIVSTRVTQAAPGETLVNRNPGNLIPNYNLLDPKTPRTVEAVVEMACLHNNIDTVALCGHADCKAMNLVHDNRFKLKENAKLDDKKSVLKTWLMLNSTASVEKFLELEKSNFKKPLKINISKNETFEAYIDPENEYPQNDKFSMVNTLVQLENLKHYKLINNLLDDGKVNAYALWLDIYCGDVLVFNKNEKRFLKLNDDSYDKLVANTN
jgi:carbonic anhydrase